MHGDDISLAYISLYYWLILNSTSNLSVHVFAGRLYAGSRILLGKLDRYLPKTINDDLVNPQRLGELHVFNNYSSSSNGLLTQRPWGREE